MGVLYDEDRAEWWAPTGRDCFLCGKVVLDTAVFWVGEGATIVLHIECAASLGSHLIADSREAALATDPTFRQRATRAAVAAIERRHRP